MVILREYMKNDLGKYYYKKSLKIPKGGNQNPYTEEEQTTE
jgi:hypothetical protein